MHVRGLSATAASMIAELPAALADGAPLRVYVAAGSPCASIYVPAFPRRLPARPRLSPSLSGEELWHAADELRQLVEADPAVLPALRDPHAHRGRAVGRGRRRRRISRPLGRCRRFVGPPGPRRAAVRHPLIRSGPAIRCGHTPVCSYSPRGM